LHIKIVYNIDTGSLMNIARTAMKRIWLLGLTHASIKLIIRSFGLEIFEARASFIDFQTDLHFVDFFFTFYNQSLFLRLGVIHKWRHGFRWCQGFCDNSNKNLGLKTVTMGGGRVQNNLNLRDVIYGRSVMQSWLSNVSQALFCW
jgi:hypothetical protein